MGVFLFNSCITAPVLCPGSISGSEIHYLRISFKGLQHRPAFLTFLARLPLCLALSAFGWSLPPHWALVVLGHSFNQNSIVGRSVRARRNHGSGSDGGISWHWAVS